MSRRVNLDALPPAELTQLRTAFSLFDDNQNGKVSPALLKHSLLSVAQTTSDSNLYRIILLLDKREGKDLTFEDFVDVFAADSAALLQGGPVTQAEAMRLFRLIDTDNTGKIGYRELRQLVDELGEPMTSAELEEMIHRADLNNDGVVDAEEFCRVISGRQT